MRTAILLSTFTLASASASAQCVTSFALKASPGATLSISMTVPLSGTWKGNYNQQSNPSGTSTIPGLFGGFGNSPIPFSSVVSPSVTVNLPLNFTVFTFCMELDGVGGATVTCGTLDIIRATPATLNVPLTITYTDFHTTQPTSIFPGVTNLPITGDPGSVNDVTGVQSAPALGTVTPGPGGSFIITATVPMLVTSTVTLLDQTVVGEPTLMNLPMVAQINGAPGSYTATVNINVAPTTTALPPADPFVNLPMELDTVLPPGNVAHLLVSGSFGNGTSTFSMNATLTGPGITSALPPDFNCDGVVDGDDLGTLLGAWGPCPGCVEDLNDDGVVDGDDLGALLGDWS